MNLPTQIPTAVLIKPILLLEVSPRFVRGFFKFPNLLEAFIKVCLRKALATFLFCKLGQGGYCQVRGPCLLKETKFIMGFGKLRNFFLVFVRIPPSGE